MATYFQVVKLVLDELYADLPAANRDGEISKALTGLAARYSNVLKRGGPDYGPDFVKFAYIFRYTTAHADFLDTIIRRSKEIGEFVKKDAVVVSCIGGGPGSDILGFVKYLLPLQPKPHVTFFLLDKDQSWGDAWWNLDAILASDLRTSNNFIPVDVTDSATWTKSKAYLKADIFTLIYFLSEIFSKRDDADKFLRSTFSKMKAGSVLIVLDFKDDDLVGWMDEIAEDCGLTAKKGTDDEEWVIDYEEEKRDLGEYYKKFGPPKIRARIFYRIFVKD